MAESENGLNELKQAIRKEKVKIYMVAGGLGVVVGAIVTGLLVGLVN